MSRIKAGDLAIIKCAEARYHNRIVEVLSVAPRDRFCFPNGVPSAPRESPDLSWVVKFIGGQALCPFNDGIARTSWYAVCPDFALFPLPGDSDSMDARQPDEMSA